jgi:hypothetical protein
MTKTVKGNEKFLLSGHCAQQSLALLGRTDRQLTIEYNQASVSAEQFYGSLVIKFQQQNINQRSILTGGIIIPHQRQAAAVM